MSSLSNFLYRDEEIANREAKSGMHHTGYFWCIISKLFSLNFNLIVSRHECDAVYTGAHFGIFADPATGIEYELRITPLNLKKIKASAL